MVGSDDLSHLELEFRKLDKEGSGTILKQRLASAFQTQLQMSQEEAQATSSRQDVWLLKPYVIDYIHYTWVLKLICLIYVCDNVIYVLCRPAKQPKKKEK